MRRTVMAIAGAALAVAGCGPKAEDGNVAADAGMTAEAITANDVTAIDAVTGDASNMAADVDLSALPARNTTDGTRTRIDGPKPRPGRPAEGPSPEPAASEPATDESPANTAE